MLRNDFVSNSSSSSYIVSSKLNENELFDYLVNEYCSDVPEFCRNWLNGIVKQYIYLLHFPFVKICYNENEEQYLYKCYEFIVPRECIDSYIDDDLNIKITPQDFFKQFKTKENDYLDYCGQLINSKYAELDIPDTAIVTNKTIAFTKWFLDNCCHDEQTYNNAVKEVQNFKYENETQKKNFEKYLCETYGDKAFISEEIRNDLTKDLSILENCIKDDKTCYIVRFGYSGEGSGPWIYTDKKLENNDIVQFNYLRSY